MEELKNKFLSLKDNDKFQRVTPLTHPVPWFIGLNGHGNFALFAITKEKPVDLKSTKLMNYFFGRRHDGNYGITFSLKDKKNLDLFVHFSEDMISHTTDAGETDNKADIICIRYYQWQKAFEKTNGDLLSFEEIKGLIGELCFLKMKMIPEYGADKAIASWSGIEATDQDFTCDETWFEVKSTVSGSSAVKISSVEQLDVSNDGHLVVVRLDKTSEADSSKLTLNSIVSLVIDSVSTKVAKEKLQNRLLAFGYYYDKAYDNIGFKYNGMTMYKVDSDFPCLRKNNIPASVKHAKYELSLGAIEPFREE